MESDHLPGVTLIYKYLGREKDESDHLPGVTLIYKYLGREKDGI